MNESVAERLKDLALYIERFRELGEEEQSWLRQLMMNGKAVLSCLDILDEIENRSLNYYELAAIMRCSPETVKQKLNALIAGGMMICEERDGRFVSPIGGRPRKLTRRVK